MQKTTVKQTIYILIGMIACGLPSGCTRMERATAVGPIATPQTFSVHTLGLSVERRPIDLYRAGSGYETIFIFAAIHGNEQAGIPLCYRLMERLRHRCDLLDKYRILIIPNANPDGVVRNVRGNANGIDLNRNFPAANRENTSVFGYYALSEPESKLLYDLIEHYRPIRVVSLHQPLKCIDYDGPAEALAQHIAAYCHLPVNKLGARPGSFGAYAGEKLGIATITMELERADDRLTADQLWQRYGAALMAAITYPEPPY